LVALTQDPGDFARLPVDDARQDQVQAAAGVHLLPQLAGVDPAAPPVKDVPGQAWDTVYDLCTGRQRGSTGILPRPKGADNEPVFPDPRS
jgi:hypothetical protein